MVALPELQSPTAAAMDAARVAANKPRDGYRLSPSTLGHECERSLWYSFRWVSPPEVFDGQKLRLFEDGNLGEAQLVAEMRAAGLNVVDREPHGEGPTVQWKQIGISFADGHGYGYLDGEVTGVIEAPVVVHVAEIKTHKNVSFNATKKHGVQKQKPDHYVQMMMYMHHRGRTRALYVFKNKDTSEIDCQRIDYCVETATALNLKAERIAYSERPLPKLHDDPEAKAAFHCRFMCNHRGVCHDGAMPRRNCRTCIFATPQRGGAWTCEKHGHELDREAQGRGCANHLLIPDLVPGEQVDADIGAGWIEYRMRDGATWRDQGGLS